jgi:uncharacterized secreted protein with C-terminal beta-propeller domain
MKKSALTVILLVSLTVGVFTSIPYLTQDPKSDSYGLQTFRSEQELKNFVSDSLEAAEKNYQEIGWGLPGIAIDEAIPVSADRSMSLLAGGSVEYSGTNIQVAGVDEADILKTDGKYIYYASGNRFFILDAFPAEDMEIVSSNSVENRIMGLFINGDMLIVLKDSYIYYDARDEPRGVIEPEAKVISPYTHGFHVEIYDISLLEEPTLIRTVFLNGTYVNSRMIGDWVYVVASQPVMYWIQERNEVVLPTLFVDGESEDLPVNDIFYSNVTDIASSYTTILALNVHDDNDEPVSKAVLTGYSSTIYVSQSNIYITLHEGGWWSGEGDTVIHRISIDGGNILVEASGSVPGRILNQFSMDEHEDHFRIATTVGFNGREQSTSVNNVYVLDSNLNVVGSLEDLAPGESIYSARFMGDRGYLVTFKKVDPLFTIDLSVPNDPKVLGKLKIPGYSDYLHPYDENHLIGIGKEAVEAKEGDFAWYQGLKISLFNVEDVENPIEVGKLTIGDRGTESPVLHDHHALLFDKTRNLLVLPVLEAKIFPEKYPGGVEPSTYGEFVYQGAFVLNIDIQSGFEVKGKITHIEDPEEFMKSGYYFDSRNQIVRSMYIEDVLYTISNQKIMANNLEDLAEISTAVFP